MKLRKLMTSTLVAAALFGSPALYANNHLGETEEAIVYDTPFSNMVILEWLLSDNETWCRIYVRRGVWEAAKANAGKLPDDADIGRIDCEKRR